MATEEEEAVGAVGLLLVHYQAAENNLTYSAVLFVRTNLSEPTMRSPNTNGAFFVTSDHAGAVRAKSDNCNGIFVAHLIFPCVSGILVPECDAAVVPSNGQRLENWVPFEAYRYAHAALNLKVFKFLSFFVYEDNSWKTCCNSKNHVEIGIAPSRMYCNLPLGQLEMSIKE